MLSSAAVISFPGVPYERVLPPSSFIRSYDTVGSDMESTADMRSHASRTVSVAAWILAAFALACDAAYVVVIAQEGNLSFGWPVVVFVAAYAAGLAASAVAGRGVSDPT